MSRALSSDGNKSSVSVISKPELSRKVTRAQLIYTLSRLHQHVSANHRCTVLGLPSHLLVGEWFRRRQRSDCYSGSVRICCGGKSFVLPCIKASSLADYPSKVHDHRIYNFGQIPQQRMAHAIRLVVVDRRFRNLPRCSLHQPICKDCCIDPR